MPILQNHRPIEPLCEIEETAHVYRVRLEIPEEAHPDYQFDSDAHELRVTGNLRERNLLRVLRLPDQVMPFDVTSHRKGRFYEIDIAKH